MVKQWLFFLFLLPVLGCGSFAPSEKALRNTPIQIAREYVDANSASLNDQFATVVLATPRAEGLTREDIVSRVEWSFVDLSGGTDNLTSVTAMARAQIPYEGWRISPIVSFRMLIDRRQGEVLSVTADSNANINRTQIAGAQPTSEPPPTIVSLPKSVLAVLTPTARPRPTRVPPTRTPIPVSQQTPVSAEQRSVVSRALSDSMASCIWNIAQTDELPTLPADWVASPETMEQLEAAGAGTPEDLHAVAKFDVSGHNTYEEYSAVAYEVSQGDESALYTLSLHYLYCNELWQGREATEVAGHDDAVAAVAECVGNGALQHSAGRSRWRGQLDASTT